MIFISQDDITMKEVVEHPIIKEFTFLSDSVPDREVFLSGDLKDDVEYLLAYTSFSMIDKTVLIVDESEKMSQTILMKIVQLFQYSSAVIVFIFMTKWRDAEFILQNHVLYRIIKQKNQLDTVSAKIHNALYDHQDLSEIDMPLNYLASVMALSCVADVRVYGMLCQSTMQYDLGWNILNLIKPHCQHITSLTFPKAKEKKEREPKKVVKTSFQVGEVEPAPVKKATSEVSLF